VVFGNNRVKLEKGNFILEINARDSLRFCNFDVRQNRLVNKETFKESS
jgi:hypothetical protein